MVIAYGYSDLLLSFSWPTVNLVGSVVECSKRRDCDKHSLGLKPTCTILLFPWERHLTTLSPVLAVLASTTIQYLANRQQYLGTSGSRSG